jgi:hypothetical protein
VSSSTGEARDTLAAAQHALLAALVAGAPPPAGFDPARLAVQARALLAKRTRSAAGHHPKLAVALGDDAYRAAFAAYAQVQPLPGNSHADAVAFEAHLKRLGRLPDLPGNPRRRWRRRPGRPS